MAPQQQPQPYQLSQQKSTMMPYSGTGTANDSASTLRDDTNDVKIVQLTCIGGKRGNVTYLAKKLRPLGCYHLL